MKRANGQGRSIRVASLVAATLLLAGAVSAQEAPDQKAAEPSGSRARLEQQLQAQLAANEALKARIAKLEAALKGDVCADPAAAEALLKEDKARGGAARAAKAPAGAAPLAVP